MGMLGSVGLIDEGFRGGLICESLGVEEGERGEGRVRSNIVEGGLVELDIRGWLGVFGRGVIWVVVWLGRGWVGD